MNEPAVYVNERDRFVAIQWDPRGPFILVREDGTVTEQWRMPIAHLAQPTGRFED
jgi:hypothetical protein